MQHNPIDGGSTPTSSSYDFSFPSAPIVNKKSSEAITQKDQMKPSTAKPKEGKVNAPDNPRLRPPEETQGDGEGVNNPWLSNPSSIAKFNATMVNILLIEDQIVDIESKFQLKSRQSAFDFAKKSAHLSKLAKDTEARDLTMKATMSFCSAGMSAVQAIKITGQRPQAEKNLENRKKDFETQNDALLNKKVAAPVPEDPPAGVAAAGAPEALHGEVGLRGFKSADKLKYLKNPDDPTLSPHAKARFDRTYTAEEVKDFKTRSNEIAYLNNDAQRPKQIQKEMEHIHHTQQLTSQVLEKTVSGIESVLSAVYRKQLGEIEKLQQEQNLYKEMAQKLDESAARSRDAATSRFDRVLESLTRGISDAYQAQKIGRG